MKHKKIPPITSGLSVPKSLNRESQSTVKKRPGKVPMVLESLYFIRLAHKLRYLSRIVTGKEAPSLLENDLPLLKEWANNKEIKDSHRPIIHLHILSHFMQKNPETFSDEDWSQIYLSWIHMQSSEIFLSHLEEERPHLWYIRKWHCSLEHQWNSLGETPSPLKPTLLTILRSLEIIENSSEIEITRQSPMTYRCQLVEDTKGVWDVNLRTGQISTPNGPLTLGERYEEENPHFNRLFGTREHLIRKSGESLFFTDQLYGEIEVIDGNFTDGLYRKEGGKCYRYLPYDNENLQKLNLSHIFISDYSHWLDPEDQSIHLIDLFTGEKAGKISYNTGCVTLHSHPNLEVSRAPSLDKTLTRFENPKFITPWENKERLKEIEFPRYSSQNGATLTFRKKDGKFVYSLNPKFFLSDTPEHSPMHFFNNCLFLKNEQGETKVLIPYRTFEGGTKLSQIPPKKNHPKVDLNEKQRGSKIYFEYDYKHGTLQANNPESYLFLSHLFLLQKKYGESLHYLSQIKRSASPSSLLSDLFYLFLDSGPSFSDFTPNACAIRLRAYWIFNMLFPQLEINGLDKDSPHKTVKDIYECYSNNLLNINRSFILSEERKTEVERFLNFKPKQKKTQAVIKTRLAENAGMNLNYNLANEDKEIIFPDVKGKYINLPPLDKNSYVLERFIYDYTFLSSEEKTPIEKASHLYNLSKIPYSNYYFHYLKFAYNNPKKVPKLDSKTDYSQKAKKTQFLAEIDKAYKHNCSENQKITIKDEPTLRPPQIPTLTHKKKEETKETNFFSELPSIKTPQEIAVEYLKEEEPIAPDRKIKEDAFNIEQAELSPQEQSSLLVVEHETARYKEEYADGKAANDTKKCYEIKEEREIAQLIVSIEESSSQYEARCQELEKTIELTVKRLPLEEHSRHLLLTTHASGSLPTPSFIELLRAGILPQEQSEETYRSYNPTLDDHDIATLQLCVKEYLKAYTQMQQLNNARKPLQEFIELGHENQSQKQNLWEKACETLQATPQYTPDEDLLVLFFEYICGFRIRKVQATIVKASNGSSR